QIANVPLCANIIRAAAARSLLAVFEDGCDRKTQTQGYTHTHTYIHIHTHTYTYIYIYIYVM
ncbi:hypothetical protein WUBG_15351, partial [Wuchereria bancrofti]